MTNEPIGYTANCANDLLNTLPTMFGFVPEESIIGVTVFGASSRCGFRLRHDLPEEGYEADLAQALAHHLVRNGGDGYLVISISADANCAKHMALALRDALPTGSCQLVLWASAGQAWIDGQSAEPVNYELTADHEARVRAVLGGQVILESRGELVNEVSRGETDSTAHLDRLCDEVVAERVASARGQSPQQFQTSDTQLALALIEKSTGATALTDRELIELAILASDVRVRDELWVRISGSNARQLHQLWAAASRLVRPELSIAALCLTGFCAWQAGDGARALVAVDRARELDPQYSMAKVLSQVLLLGINPDSWAPNTLTA